MIHQHGCHIIVIESLELIAYTPYTTVALCSDDTEVHASSKDIDIAESLVNEDLRLMNN